MRLALNPVIARDGYGIRQRRPSLYFNQVGVHVFHSRGLRGVHLRYGLSARQAAFTALYIGVLR